jgi:hypothetical protein
MMRHKTQFRVWFLTATLSLGVLAWTPISFSRLMQEGGEDQLMKDNEAKMAKQREDEAFNKLKEETDKFYEAAGELKSMVEKTNRHTYSLQIIKKTEELEKMLKEIRRRVKEGL